MVSLILLPCLIYRTECYIVEEGAIRGNYICIAWYGFILNESTIYKIAFEIGLFKK
jgi:hypothetical protein